MSDNKVNNEENQEVEEILIKHANGQWELVKNTLDYSTFNKPTKQDDGNQYTIDYNNGKKPTTSGKAWTSNDVAGKDKTSPAKHSKTSLKERRINNAVQSGSVIDDRPIKTKMVKGEDEDKKKKKKDSSPKAEDKTFKQKLEDIKAKYRDEFSSREEDPAAVNTRLSAKEIKKDES